MSSSKNQFVYACVYQVNLIKSTTTDKNHHNTHVNEELILEDPDNKPQLTTQLIGEYYYGLDVSTGPGISQDHSEHFSQICGKVAERLLLRMTETTGKLSISMDPFMINCLRNDPYLFISCSEDVSQRIVFQFLQKLEEEFKKSLVVQNENKYEEIISEEERMKNNSTVHKLLNYFNNEYVDPITKMKKELEEISRMLPDNISNIIDNSNTQ